MRFVRIALTFICMVSAFIEMDAETVRWSISPKYEIITRHQFDFFVFQQNGKWGLVRPGNVEILPPSFDYITPFVNGYALAGSNIGSQHLLEYIISDRGDVTKVREMLYLPSSYRFFSEGKLTVVNRDGKYGYIDTFGKLIIRCQFDMALPFKENWAPVRTGNYFKYIGEKYDTDRASSVLPVDFHYGEMTAASCFAGGKAVVAYNNDFAVIGKNGNRIGKMNETEFKRTYVANNSIGKVSDGYIRTSVYSEYSEKGRFGLRFGQDVIVIPQFESVIEQYSDGLIIVQKNGKQGLIEIVEGDYHISFTPGDSQYDLQVDKDGNVECVKVNVASPVPFSGHKLLIDCGNGIMRDVTSETNVNGYGAEYVWLPKANGDTDNCSINVFVENDGIAVADAGRKYTLSYPVKLRVSSPKAVSYKADENDNVTIYSIIYNDSNIPVTVDATLRAINSVTRSFTINPQSSVRISITEQVKTSRTVTATISLSTGETATNRELYLEPFF